MAWRYSSAATVRTAFLAERRRERTTARVLGVSTLAKDTESPQSDIFRTLFKPIGEF
uniref:Uncharacterized protein n=1 Tax=Anguilla anguilla TaxID=7936 RepID=A0A0E9RNY3_ANGAN